MLHTTATPGTAPAHSATRLRSVDIAGPEGRLEALLNEGDADPRFVALVCHPHPLGGGTLHNKVVYHAMKVLNAPEWGFGYPVLRFNFRGTGLSQGSHHGTAEAGDVVAALQWLEQKFNLPALVVGFSFGAAMALAACCGNAGARVRALVSLGLPVQSHDRSYAYPFLAGCSTPKLFLSGDRDQFAPAHALQQIVATAAQPKQLVLIPGADHFFTGHLDAMQRTLAEWLKADQT